MVENVTRKQVLERINTCELNGDFNKHVDPIDYDIAMTVDENFKYIFPLSLKIKYFFTQWFVVKPLSILINKDMGTKVLGRENLKGIKSAVITCNHVNKFDCVVVRKGMRFHKLYITAAHFNNQKGFLGSLMRASRMLPFGENMSAMKNMNNAIDKYLHSNNYVLFYPEEAMWWNYEKPRPYKPGAFKYAAKANVPVIPTFITYTNTGKFDDEGIEKKQFTLNILKPIYPKAELSIRENTERFKNIAFEECTQKYEAFYNKPLEYLCDSEKTQRVGK